MAERALNGDVVWDRRS